MKSEIVKENDIYKDWSIDDEINEATLQQMIEINQTIINELENDDFPKKVWEYCTYSKENILKEEIEKSF
jgi:alcohol dehydrogenase YqhD (iron-dependent ADH family)